MKKFLFMYLGEWEYTDAMKQAWGAWFAKVGPHLVDGGSPLGPGRALSASGMLDLTPDSGAPITGYSIISAESMEHAERLLDGVPFVDSVRVYECMSM